MRRSTSTHGTGRSNSAAAAAFAFAMVWAAGADARPTGEGQACQNCHYQEQGPMIELSFSNPELDPGESVTLTIDVEAVQAEALRSGFFIFTPDQGTFGLVDPTTTRSLDPKINGVVHSQPTTLDASGRAQFQVEWTAPKTPGVADFVVWSITGNSNGESGDDHHAMIERSVAFGCDAKNYYLDADSDGFGDIDSAMLSCDPVPGRLDVGGDCDDANALVNPDAPELCNFIDDDCNGETDDGLSPGLYFPDVDGDGFGDDFSEAELSCAGEPGMADVRGDCEPTNADVYPGAPELPNGIDDDCDGIIDEEDDPAGTEEGDGGATDGPEEATSGAEAGAVDGGGGAGASGCRIAPSRGAPTPLWLLVAFAVGWPKRRNGHPRAR